MTSPITSATQSSLLLENPPPSLRSRVPRAQPSPQSGSVFQQAINAMTDYTQRRLNDPSLESAHVQSIKDFYKAFKTRVSQFTLDPSVSKTALLQDLLSGSGFASLHPETFNRVMHKCCQEEMEELTIDPIAHSELGKVLKEIDVKAIQDRIQQQVDGWCARYENPPSSLKETLQKECYAALLRRYAPMYQGQIQLLESPDPTLQARLKAALLRDLHTELSSLKEQDRQWKETYSDAAQKELQERLDQLEREASTLEAPAKVAFQAVVSAVPSCLDSQDLAQIDRQPWIPIRAVIRHLPPNDSQKAALQLYLQAREQVCAQQEKLKTFFLKQQEESTRIRQNLSRNEAYRTQPLCQTRFCAERREAVCSSYRSLLELLGDKRAEVRSCPTSSSLQNPLWYSASLYLSAGAMYYALYCGACHLWSSFVE